VRKISPSQTVLYFGDIYEIRGEVGVIHVFAGNRRVASVRLDGRTQFYHPNHLGSASVITDAEGGIKQRIEYFPFGTYRISDPPVPQETYDFDDDFPNVNYTFTDQEDDGELGFYNYGARLYDPVLGKSLSADSIVQAPEDPQTLNRYSYARNNPIIYTDPSGHWFGIDDLIAAIAGAIKGSIEAAIFGENIWKGALKGAFSAWIMYNTGVELRAAGVIVEQGGKEIITNLPAAVGAHMAAGAVSGAFNTVVSGGNLGQNMVTSAVSAGIAKGLGNYIPSVDNDYLDFGIGVVGHGIIGGITGGISAEIYGGKFGLGFREGAIVATFGYLFNKMGRRLWMVLQAGLQFAIGKGVGGSATIYLRAHEPSQYYIALDENTGAGAGEGLGGGFAYTDDPDSVRGSLNVCYQVCISVLFSESGWPVGVVISKGGLGVWWSEPFWANSGRWEE